MQVCTDEAVSGTTDALDRDGLACALGAIESGTAEALVVPRLDRLARSLTVQEAALSLVWAHGGRVFTVDTGEVQANDPDDPMRTFVRQVTGAVAELEAGMIRKRLRDGRRAKRDAGGYAGGAPAYGWRAEGRSLEPDPEQARVIDQIRALQTEGASIRQVAEILNAEGTPSKRGGRWHPTTVARILARAETREAAG